MHFQLPAQIARALVTAATHQLPIKFTAGLHHPIRQFRDEVKTKMHGFLNVLGAAVLAAEHRWDADQAVTMLEDEDPRSFSFTDDFFAWRDWKIDTERLQYRRKFVRSFGSCSFDEPRDDLRALEFTVGRQCQTPQVGVHSTTPYNSIECLSNRSSKFHRIRIFRWRIFPSAFSNRDKANRVWALRLGI